MHKLGVLGNPCKNNAATTRNPYIVLFGFVTVAGLLYKGNINNVDLDTLIDFGTYYFNNGCTNQPDKIENGCLVVIKSTSGRCVQLAFRAKSYQFAFRMQWNDFSQEGNPVVWNKWVYLAFEEQ